VARKDRKGAAEERLEGLLGAGDWRAARVEAERLAASEDPGAREAAARAEVRLAPGPSARLAFVGGLVFLAVVAAAGLWLR
jgi:hypothetical protein